MLKLVISWASLVSGSFLNGNKTVQSRSDSHGFAPWYWKSGWVPCWHHVGQNEMLIWILQDKKYFHCPPFTVLWILCCHQWACFVGGHRAIYKRHLESLHGHFQNFNCRPSAWNGVDTRMARNTSSIVVHLLSELFEVSAKIFPHYRKNGRFDVFYDGAPLEPIE